MFVSLSASRSLAFVSFQPQPTTRIKLSSALRATIELHAWSLVIILVSPWLRPMTWRALMRLVPFFFSFAFFYERAKVLSWLRLSRVSQCLSDVTAASLESIICNKVYACTHIEAKISSIFLFLSPPLTSWYSM